MSVCEHGVPVEDAGMACGMVGNAHVFVHVDGGDRPLRGVEERDAELAAAVAGEVAAGRQRGA